MRLRMTSADSIILWAGGDNMDIDTDFIMLEVEDGFVQVRWVRIVKILLDISVSKFNRDSHLSFHSTLEVVGSSWSIMTQESTTVAGTESEPHGRILTTSKIFQLKIFCIRVDQTASLQVDNGDTVTARAPGYLTQLNILPTLYLGKHKNIFQFLPKLSNQLPPSSCSIKICSARGEANNFQLLHFSTYRSMRLSEKSVSTKLYSNH